MAIASSMRWQGAAAEIYLQALEWLWAALAGPDAAATEAACVPETEAELERHRDFVRRRGGVEAQVPDAKLVLWSKVLAVVEQPNGLTPSIMGPHPAVRLRCYSMERRP